MGAQRVKHLSKILQADLCVGCGLCTYLSDGALPMHLDDAGYLRPREDRSINEAIDKKILEFCPGVRLSTEAGGRKEHTLWGPYVEVRTGFASESKLRHHASSGGALSALLNHLLETGTVDYVVQVAASTDRPIENEVRISFDQQDVYTAAGSRYAPSAPLTDLASHLERPGRFALVGKPCDIAAARSLSTKDPVVRDKIAVFLSFFCAGVPSIKGVHAIVDQLGMDVTDLEQFSYRGDGWPGHATATGKDGTRERMDYASSWGGILSKHVQFRCKICPDGTGSFADIVCADAWICDEKGYPLFEEQDGQSLIMTRTDFGEEIVRGAMASGAIEAQPLPVEQIEAMQPGQSSRRRLVLSRLMAMRLLGLLVPKFSGFHLFRNAISAGLWPNIRNMLGTARRLIWKGDR